MPIPVFDQNQNPQLNQSLAQNIDPQSRANAQSTLAQIPDQHAKAVDDLAQSSWNRAQQAALNLQNIQTARAQIEHQQGQADIEKKKTQILMDEAQHNGQMSDVQRRMLEAQIKEQQKITDEKHKANLLVNQQAEDQHTNELNQSVGLLSALARGMGQAQGGAQPIPTASVADQRAGMNPPMIPNATQQDWERPVSQYDAPPPRWEVGMGAPSHGVAPMTETDAYKNYEKNQQKMVESPLSRYVGDYTQMDSEEIKERLKRNNPHYYDYLKGISDGDTNIRSRGANADQTYQDVKALFPEADSTLIQARQKVRNDFTSGKTANNIASLNTAIHHLDRMAETGKQLNGTNFRWGNKLANVIKTQTGDPAVKRFGADLAAVTGELAATFKASGATDTEIANFKAELDKADSPKQIQGTVEEFIRLIAGRTQPIFERWQTTMGDFSKFPVVGKSSMKILSKHGFQYDPETGNIGEGAPVSSGKFSNLWE